MWNRKVTLLKVLAICFALLTLLVIVSCASVQQAAAPVPSASPSAIPAQNPYIEAISARILLVDGKFTNNITVDISTPGSPIGFDWLGDIIFYKDVDPPTTQNQSALTSGGSSQTTFENFVEWKNVAPGKHMFSAQLVTQSDMPLNPPIVARILIDVPQAGSTAPALQSVTAELLSQSGVAPLGMPAPPRSTGQPSADINMIPDTLNFKIVNKIGQAAVPGEGHYIHYFNIQPPATPGKPAFTDAGSYVVTADTFVTWVNVVPGQYNVWVQLVNNDNTPLQPPVVAGATIIVPPDANRYSAGL